MSSKINGVLLGIGVFLFVQATPREAIGDKQPVPVARIAVLKDIAQVVLTTHGLYTILDPTTNQTLFQGREFSKINVRAVTDGIDVDGKIYSYPRLRFIFTRDVGVEINQKERKYRGNFDIIKTHEGRLVLVNRLPVEEYIQGVLYHEISHRWPMEAIKAQAVAARTYALYQMEVNTQNDFDVTNDIYSQVYGGRTSERYRTNLAVKRTQGEILVFQGKILPAYFHATCGGATENVRELWNHDGLAPLRGVRCHFCADSPHFHWKKNFRLKDLQDKLNAAGYHLGLIKEINILERNRSERIKNLEIITRDGKTTSISGKDFRNIVGPNNIRSTNFEIFMKGYYVDIVGKGWGHGVGLCQWGARGLAMKRYSYKGILEYYYPGAAMIKQED